MPSYTYTWATSDFSMGLGETVTITLDYVNKGETIPIYEDGVQIGTTTTNTYEYTPTTNGTHTLQYLDTIVCKPLNVTVTGGNIVSGNDTATLNSALTELGELLADNLTSMGVSSSASEGLTTLANKVSDVTASGSCYNASFTESSYSADYDFDSNKSVAKLKVYCQYQYEPSTSGTVKVTGDNNTYTANIGEDGYAIANVELTSNSTTFTVNYRGSTDTCTVTKRNYLFLDACNSNAKLSKYGNPIPIYNTSISGNPTLEYNSTDNCYKIYGISTSDYVVFPISDLDGLNNFTISCEMKVYPSSSYPYFGLSVFPSESSLTSVYAEIFYNYRYSTTGLYTYVQRRRRTTYSSVSYSYPSFDRTQWFRLIVTFNDSNGVTARWETLDGEKLSTITTTVSASTSDRHYGLYMRSGSSTTYKGSIRHIKVWRN